MTTVFNLAGKKSAFQAKLDLWRWRVNRFISDMFQTLAYILEKTEPEHSFSPLVHDHLSLCFKEFESYFPTTKDPQTGKEWIHGPLINKPGKTSVSVQEDQLLEITNDGSLESMLETSTLPIFSIKFMADYLDIATTVLETLLLFQASYLCEAGFSFNHAAVINMFWFSVQDNPTVLSWTFLRSGEQTFNDNDCPGIEIRSHLCDFLMVLVPPAWPALGNGCSTTLQ